MPRLLEQRPKIVQIVPVWRKMVDLGGGNTNLVVLNIRGATSRN